MATLVGIDLGTHTVKLAVLEGRLGKVQISDYRLRAVPRDDNGDASLEDRLEVLQGLLAELSLEDSVTFAAALRGEQVSVRNVPMPFSDRDRISKTLGFELEGYVPFDIDDVVLDYRVHPEGDGARVLCALAPRERVAEMVAGLSGVGADPRHLVLDADVLATYGEPGDGAQAVIDIGHERTLVAVVRGGEHLAVRTISRGGEDLTRALVERLGMSWADAEGAKHAASLSRSGDSSPLHAAVVEDWNDEELTDPEMLPPAATPNLAIKQKGGVDDVLHAALVPLLGSLRATLIAVEDELDLGIDEVLVTGGSASLDGLVSLLSSELGVPVRPVQVSPEAQALGDAGRFGLAHALGLRAAGMTGGQELSFRKDDFAFKGDLATMRTYVAVGLVAVLAFCIVGTGLFGLRWFQYGQQIRLVEAEIGQVVLATFPDVPAERVGDATTAKNIMLEKTSETMAKVDALGDTVGGEPPTLTLLKEISSTMPGPDEARIDVKEMTVSLTGVSMKAETTGYEAAATIEKALQGNERFRAAKKSEEKKLGDGIGFNLSIPFDAEEEG
jgi:general secretion pathway protein L